MRTEATVFHPPPLVEVGAWQEQAACRGANADLFFPERGSSTRKAKSICFHECLVREECLEQAISAGEKFGIWGGMSERERRQIRRERQEARTA